MPIHPTTKDSFVRTVLGDIPAQEVGFAQCHEHAFILPGRASELDPDILLDDLEKTTAELLDFRRIDGRTIVDAQSLGQERAPQLQKAASERSGVNIVACTGLYRGMFYPADHFRFRESSDEIAQRFIEEINSGMAIYRGSEVVERTDIRAGLIKFATDYHTIDDNARLVAEAVAAAHLKTGAPILTHCERGTCGVEQIELFEKLGVHPSSLILSHLDRNLDIYLHEDIADSGAYMVYDGISRVEWHTDQEIIQMIRSMLERGYGRQILLSMDMGRRSMWKSYGGGPGINYLGNQFLVKLRRAGLTAEPIDAFINRNPADALAFRKFSEAE
jgi:predicted metal-dependent phosphotriesterase family hydrolase